MMAEVVANIIVTVATALASPIGRQLKYLFCVNKVVNDLEDARKELTEERDNMNTRIEQAEKKTHVIETSVTRWVDDVENLLIEVDDLVQRTNTDIHCFQGWFPMRGRYLFCKKMVTKIKAMGKFKGTSKDFEPFSHLAPLRGIPNASEDFIYFASTKKAYDELFDALKDDSTHMIGLYGAGGCGKTTLATEVGTQAQEKKMFDMVIRIPVSQKPNFEDILGRIEDKLVFEPKGQTVHGRTERLSSRLEIEKDKRILFIVDDLWSQFNMMDIGICHVNRHTWKILVVTHKESICTLMDCQKMIHLRHLSEDESWTLFKKLAKIDDKRSELLDGVPRKICDECKGVLIAIKTMASSLKGKHHTKWKSTLAKLVDSKAFVGHVGGEMNALNCIKLSYDCLQNTEAELLFLMCCMFPQDYHIPIEDLTRYALGVLSTYSFQLLRSLVEACINRLLESNMLMRGSVKMHNMVRDAAFWIANRSDNFKILVNVDKPLSTVAEDNRIKDCFALSSWWFNENPSFCQLHAPNLKMLLVNISAHSSLNSLDLSPLTFEGIQGLQVFSLTINYKIIPISFPPSIQLLTNVRTLRLNGLKLGDMSFIGSLETLEVLDLRRCYFNELPIEIRNLESLKLLDLSECHFSEKSYNRAIGKCSQLEELYASKCYPKEYVDEIIMDISILQNLRRFVLGDPIIPERTRAVQVNDFNISKLTTSNKNILQIAETISLSGLHGGSKNIIPDMVGVIGGMNNLSTLHLTSCKEIECIFDTTCDLKEDYLIPRLVELRLVSMDNLTELCHGPPLQVLHYFEKLEVLDIEDCEKLHIIFPRQCNLRNIKILSLSNCRTDEVLFSESVAQSLQQLEQLRIYGCNELKHFIAAGGSKHSGFSSEEIIAAPMNLMTNLRDVVISSCQSLESIFPLCYVEGLPRLQKMSISHAPNLKYVFGKCDHKHLSSHQNLNDHVMLPHLEDLYLGFNLNNFIGMCPANYQANWLSQSLKILNIQTSPKVAIPWFNLNVGYDQIHHPLNEILSFQCLEHLTVAFCKELKCLFSIESHRSLPELMELCVYKCQELEQIVAANAEHVELPNAELYFPKLKKITVYNCHKLKSLFPLSMVTMLPQLSILDLSRATELQEVFRHSQGDDIVNKMEIVLPNLTEITLDFLPNFEDICHGCKLHAIKLLRFNLSNCPKIAPGLTKIQDQIEEASEVEDNSSRYPYPTSSISNDVEDFIYFESTKVAYNQLFQALKDDYISIIGLYGKGGCGKTTLVTEVAKKVKELDMFEKVISITVSRTPDIRDIQGEIADMLNLKLGEESEEGRAQCLRMCLKEMKRILIIVDDLWSKSHLMDIGIRLDEVVMKKTLKILITTRHERVCRSMDFQKEIHLELLSEDESWNLFQKFARIDDEDSKIWNNVPRKICNECMGLPIAIKIVGPLFNERKDIEWEQVFEKLRISKAYDRLRNDNLPGQEAEQIFGLCSLFLEDDTPTYDLVRYAHGLSKKERTPFRSRRTSRLLDSCLRIRLHEIEPFQHRTLQGRKLKQKKFEKMNLDLDVDMDETKEKLKKKRIVESSLSDQSHNIAP